MKKNYNEFRSPTLTHEKQWDYDGSLIATVAANQGHCYVCNAQNDIIGLIDARFSAYLQGFAGIRGPHSMFFRKN